MRRLGLGVGWLICLAACPSAPPSNPDGGGGGGDPAETQGGATAGSGPHLESGGRVVVEAEHFTRTATDYLDLFGVHVPLGNRDWYVQPGQTPTPDPDGLHGGASGDAYVECLPDTRVDDDDPFDAGAFYDDLGGATADYEIQFETPGRYYVWVRAYSTGTEDNGVHVLLDGALPGSGARIQVCGTNEWRWSNAQRDSGGTSCGVNGTIYVDVADVGLHTITFSHREDGFELDRFVLTTDTGYTPQGAGPVESPRANPP